MLAQIGNEDAETIQELFPCFSKENEYTHNMSIEYWEYDKQTTHLHEENMTIPFFFPELPS